MASNSTLAAVRALLRPTADHRRLLAGGLLVVVIQGALIWSLMPPVAPATALVLAALLAVALWSLWRHANAPWRALAQALEGWSAADLTQQAVVLDAGPAGRVTQALRRIGAELDQRQRAVLSEARLLRELLDHVPVPVLCVDDAGTVVVANRGARRLLGSDPRERATLVAAAAALTDAVQVGAPIPAAIDLNVDGVRQRLALRAADVILEARRHRILTLLSVQADLDAAGESTARNLVRVLTHELGNGLTPIAALADALEEMLGADVPADVAAALGTLRRRAQALREFAENAQRYARALPTPRATSLAAAEWLVDLVAAERGAWPQVDFGLDVEAGLVVVADAGLLRQALTNLLRNAAQAAIVYAGSPQVRLTAKRLSESVVAIDVDDNGAGVDADTAELMFLPFFSTRPGGSGIGATLARQVTLAHGGSLSVQRAPLGGARLRVVLPAA